MLEDRQRGGPARLDLEDDRGLGAGDRGWAPGQRHGDRDRGGQGGGGEDHGPTIRRHVYLQRRIGRGSSRLREPRGVPRV